MTKKKTTKKTTKRKPAAKAPPSGEAEEEHPDTTRARRLAADPNNKWRENTRPALVTERTPTGSVVGRWPEGLDPPPYHSRATIHPCESCKAVSLNGGQAVIIKGAASGMAHLECRSCGHKFRRVVGRRPFSF